MEYIATTSSIHAQIISIGVFYGLQDYSFRNSIVDGDGICQEYSSENLRAALTEDDQLMSSPPV